MVETLGRWWSDSRTISDHALLSRAVAAGSTQGLGNLSSTSLAIRTVPATVMREGMCGAGREPMGHNGFICLGFYPEITDGSKGVATF